MATYTVRAAGGNWSVAATWSTAGSGGAAAGTPPGTSDDVILEAGSGNSTINSSITVGSVDCMGGTGNFAGTLTHSASASLTLSGNGANKMLRLSPGMTYTKSSLTSSAIIFTNTSGTCAVTTNHASNATAFFSNVTQNGAGGTVQLQDDLFTNSTAILTVTAGTFDANNKNVNVGGGSFTGGTTLCGTGTWTFNTTGGSVTFAGTSLSAASAAFVFAGFVIATGVALTFGTNNSFGSITLGPGAGQYLMGGTTAVTFGSFTAQPGAEFRLVGGINWIATQCTLQGTPANPVLAKGQDGVAASNFNIPANSQITWAVLNNIAFSNSPVAYNSYGFGGSGITILPPLIANADAGGL